MRSFWVQTKITMKQTSYIITNSLQVLENIQENREEAFKHDQEFHNRDQAETHAIRHACEEPDETGFFQVYFNDHGQDHKVTDSEEAGSFQAYQDAQDFADEENERILAEGSKESNFETVDLPQGWSVYLSACRGSFGKDLVEITVTGPNSEEASYKVSTSRLDGELIVPTERIAEEILELVEIAIEESQEEH